MKAGKNKMEEWKDEVRKRMSARMKEKKVVRVGVEV